MFVIVVLTAVVIPFSAFGYVAKELDRRYPGRTL
jgi:hypothetical protein